MKILEASEDQKKQFKVLLSMPEDQKKTVLEMVKAAVKVESEKIAAQFRKELVKKAVKVPEVVKPVKDEKPVKSFVNGKRIIKNPRKLEITAPSGVPFYTKIPFSIERFKRFLLNTGIKSADIYAGGMRKMLEDHGMITGSMSLTLNDLVKLRDFYAKKTSTYASNKRGYLRKFNQYLVHEYLTNKK
jgi:hypothetical protein